MLYRGTQLACCFLAMAVANVHLAVVRPKLLLSVHPMPSDANTCTSPFLLEHFAQRTYDITSTDYEYRRRGSQRGVSGMTQV
jgi:hypothetical protein